MSEKPTYEELEKALKQANKTLSSTLESLDGLLVVIDRDRRVILSNWKDHDFVPEEERQGYPYCYKIFKHLEAPCDYCPPVDTFADGKPRIYEDRNPIDGSFKEIRVTPIKDDDGKVANVIEYVQDITKRKQAEELLKISEEKFSSSFHYSNDAIVLSDSDGLIIDVNQKTLNQFAYTKDEMLSLRFADLHPQEALGMANKAFEEVFNRGFAKYEIDFVKKNRKVFSAEVSASLFEVAGKKVIQNIIRDITESKLAEEERIRLATAIEQAAESVIIANRPGAIQYINPSFEQVSGYGLEEIVGQNFRILKSDKHDENFYKDMWDIISKGNVWAGHITNRMKDGTLREFETRISPVRDSSGEIINFVSVNRDVTQEVALAAKLQRAQKMEALGLLAGGVAHDLNNVLSGIVSYPELILESLPEDSKLKKPIETMQASGHRAAAIVQDLLTVARGVAITKEPLNLNDLIGDYLNSPEFNKLKHFHPSVTVKTNLDSDLFNVSGSSVHIRKVVMNLVSNASEAIEGRGNVTISTMNRYVDRPLKGYDEVTIGEYAVLFVSNVGSGISPVDLERIFEPFYTKKVLGKSGTGLGLAVVWNVVQDHKGYINVASDENGTKFELYFPITREEISGKDLAIPIEDFKGDGETILVVDDVESQREIACTMLDTLGYKAKAVSSGEEAVEYLTEHTVDLILLDMIMDPGINGRETYEQIIKIHPNQKAIIASGFAETDDVKESQKLGAGKYLKKPLTLEKMGIAVRDELKK